ncbi:MAG: peptidase C39 [Lachnospiraceae bacterium]|nr:peptidase C39 [Lachnospiraceae bacterium]
MQNPMSYQTSEYDCGPTAVLNAIRYLFRREDIPPVMIKAAYNYTLDGFNEHGESGKTGTSAMAMKFLSHWFNHYGKQMKFPIRTEFLGGEEVWLEPGCKLYQCLQSGGVAVIRLWYGCPHYVTAVGMDDEHIYLFDPYYRVDDFTIEGVEKIDDHPLEYNRKVSLVRMQQHKRRAYALHNLDTRELLLMYNTSEDKNFRNTPENYLLEEDEDDDDME